MIAFKVGEKVSRFWIEKVECVKCFLMFEQDKDIGLKQFGYWKIPTLTVGLSFAMWFCEFPLPK